MKKANLLMAALVLSAVSMQAEARIIRGPLDQQANFVFNEGTLDQQLARFDWSPDHDRVPANQPEPKETVVKMREDDEGTTVLFDKKKGPHYLKKKPNSTK